MEIKLNLASKPYLNRQSVRLWLGAACVVLLIILLLNASFAYQNYRQLALLENRLQELTVKATGIQGTPAGYSAQTFAAVMKNIALANEIVEADQFRWTRLLTRFEEVVPEDVSINSIQPNFKERSVQVAGVARDVTALTRFVDNLLSSDDFRQAYLQRHGNVDANQNGRAQPLTGFSLVIREAF